MREECSFLKPGKTGTHQGVKDSRENQGMTRESVFLQWTCVLNCMYDFLLSAGCILHDTT